MTLPDREQRSVLLIESYSSRRTLRALALRRCEIEVDTADNIVDAALLWPANGYTLILLAAQENSVQASILCEQVHIVKPRQRVALLVGAPYYIKEIGRTARFANKTPLRPKMPSESIFVPPQPTQWQRMLEHFVAAHH